MRLYLDECLSPGVALRLMQEDGHYAVHPRNMGGLGLPDHVILARCLEDDLVIVTSNAGDFRALARREELHPGLILMPDVGRDRSLELIRQAVAHLEALGDPATVMVNCALEIDVHGAVALYNLP